MSTGLWIRSYEDWIYRPVGSIDEAEAELAQISDSDPFRTVLQGEPDGVHTYFQAFGTPSRMLVEGGGRDERGVLWHWRASRAPRDSTPVIIGPAHHRLRSLRADQMLDVEAARQFLRPTLGDTGGPAGVGVELSGYWLTWTENLNR